MSIDQIFDQAHVAFRNGAYADAERRYRSLVRFKPLEAHYNLGQVYEATGRLKEAEVAYRAALSAKPDSPDARYALAMQLLGRGDYAEGWALHESRRALPRLNIANPNPGYPEWTGESLDGRQLLVIGEQGLGDQIQFMRFFPDLERRGATVIYLCEPPLVTLFKSNGVDAVASVVGAHFPKADFWVLLGTLPLRLGVTVESLAGAPYLKAEPKGRGGIGVKVQGSGRHTNDRNRSLSGDTAAQVKALGRDLDPAATGASDFLQTAEIVAGLDLVVTVDTSIAHLAGALGRPVHILLPARFTDWRWLRGRQDSPWYESARLYRQDVPGKWATVIRSLKHNIGS
jgi:tetratricopeptide (TPR) repeat protein